MRHVFLSFLCGLVLAGLPLRADTELSKAAISGDAKGIMTALRAGKEINGLDKWGWNALLWATYYKQDNAVRMLLAMGADPNGASKEKFRTFPVGTTPLMVAAYFGSEDPVMALLERKADPALADASGKKALDIAKGFDFKECVDLLEGRSKPVPASRLHTRAHRLVPGKITPLLLVLGSKAEASEDFLNEFQGLLYGALERCQVKATILQRSFPVPAEDKALAAKVAADKPKYVLAVTEIAAGITYHGDTSDGRRLSLADGPTRLKGTFQVTLRDAETDALLWEQILQVHDTGNFAVGIREDLMSVLITTLIAALDTDGLV